MKDVPDAKSSASATEMTGLPWPKTWHGTYLFVIGTFILWLGLLIALTEFCA